MSFVKLNGVEFKGKFLFIEIAKVKPKVTNSNKIDFTSSNRFEPLGFASNISDLGNDIEHIEEISLRVDFKRTVRDSQKNSKHISKWRSPFVINSHPENQMAFSEVPIIPGGISYNDAITKKKQQENILIFTGNIPSIIKVSNFSNAENNGKGKVVINRGTWCSFVTCNFLIYEKQYLQILKIFTYTPKHYYNPHPY